MGQVVRNDARFCQIPHFMKKRDYSAVSDRREVMVAASLIIVLAISTLSINLLWVPPFIEHEEPTIKAVIAIDGDANFSATALLEGWPGDGSPENPYIIDGLDVKVNDAGDIDGESHCIFIRNTRVSFIIRNCNITGAYCHLMGKIFAGITLVNVSGGFLVNNILHDNEAGIYLADSLSNTVVNNTCNSNYAGILLFDSHLNTVANNTCNSNIWGGILLWSSDSNTLANNICTSNDGGISLEYSNSNTVTNNTCSYNNESGIRFDKYCHYNTAVNNTCTNNEVGINFYGVSNTVANNTFLGNTEFDILPKPGAAEFVAEEPVFGESAHQEYVAKQFVWFLAGLGMILAVSVIAVVQFRRMEL